jgi:hypothetical protein
VIDQTFQLPIALALSLLLISASRHKLRARRRFQASLAAYELLPGSLLPLASGVLPVLELLIGAALLIPSCWPAAGPVAAALLSAYAFAMAINLIRGREAIDCGCGDAPQPLSLALLARNLVLVTGAILLTIPAVSRQLGTFDFFVIAMAFVGLALLYIAFEQLTSNASRLKEWRENA